MEDSKKGKEAGKEEGKEGERVLHLVRLRNRCASFPFIHNNTNKHNTILSKLRMSD